MRPLAAALLALAALVAGLSPLALVGALVVLAGAHRAVTCARRARRPGLRRRA